MIVYSHQLVNDGPNRVSIPIKKDRYILIVSAHGETFDAFKIANMYFPLCRNGHSYTIEYVENDIFEYKINNVVDKIRSPLLNTQGADPIKQQIWLYSNKYQQKIYDFSHLYCQLVRQGYKTKDDLFEGKYMLVFKNELDNELVVNHYHALSGENKLCLSIPKLLEK